METKSKKIMKTFALVLALATATATEGLAQAKASGKVSSTNKVSNLNVQDMGNLRFKLAFENPLRQKTKISLLGNNNEVFFSDFAANNTQYVRAFDLSNLGDGEYTFVVEVGSEKLTKEFAIKTQTFRGISLASSK